MPSQYRTRSKTKWRQFPRLCASRAGESPGAAANPLENAWERGVGNVLVGLYHAQTNPVSATIKGNDGQYHFTNLVTETNQVRFGLPIGYVFSLGNVKASDLIAINEHCRSRVLCGQSIRVLLALPQRDFF